MNEAVKENLRFEYTYSAKQQREIDAIRQKYLPKEENKLDTLRALDKHATDAGITVSLILGILGSLIFGVGMCCTLLWSEFVFGIGVIIGFIGVVLMISAYPAFKKVAQRQKEKIAPQILALSEELLKS